MNRRLIGFVALALVAGGAGIVAVTIQAMNRHSALRPIAKVPDPDAPAATEEWLSHYQLIDQLNRPFDSADIQGKVHVVSFFYASCPTSCFKMNTTLRDTCQEFGPRGVEFISITCDPETDTPAFLNQYARKLEAPRGWSFLTGKLDYIKRVAAEVYSVPLSRYTHVESFLVIDKWGVRRGKFLWNDPDELRAMKQLLPQLIDETTQPPPAVPAIVPQDDDDDSQ